MKPTDFVPTFNNLLVEPEEKETVSKGGIILPDTVEKPVTKGTVVAAGDGYYNDQHIWIPNTIKKGTKVIFGEFAGHEMFFDEPTRKKYLIIKETTILGVLKP